MEQLIELIKTLALWVGYGAIGLAVVMLIIGGFIWVVSWWERIMRKYHDKKAAKLTLETANEDIKWLRSMLLLLSNPTIDQSVILSALQEIREILDRPLLSMENKYYILQRLIAERL